MKAMFPLIAQALMSLSLPSPAQAQDAMTGEEFESYTKGQTFYFAEDGVPYGGEEYLNNRRVRWSFLGGECKEGYWYEDNRRICFVYEDLNGPQCWSFVKEAEGLRATFYGPEPASELYEVLKTDDPLNCPGPEVGV